MNAVMVLSSMVSSLLGCVTVPHTATTGWACASCQPSAPPLALGSASCPPVEQAVCYVPQFTNENRTITVTRYRKETRERTVVVQRSVPETREVEREYTIQVPEVRTHTVMETVYRPVPRSLELRTTNMIPQTETRDATQTVCRLVPVQEERTVCEISGHWEYRTAPGPYAVGYPATPPPATPPAVPRTFENAPGQAPDPNAPPAPIPNAQSSPDSGALPAPELAGPAASPDADAVAPPPPDPNAPPLPPAVTSPQVSTPLPGSACVSACEQSCSVRVWVPDVIQRKINVTCMKPVYEQQAVKYPVTTFRPEVQSRMVEFYEHEPEQVSREEQYTVYVPQKRVRTEQVTLWRTVPQQQREQYTVMVPYQEQQQVSVPVCRLVPHTVSRPVLPSCDLCCP